MAKRPIEDVLEKENDATTHTNGLSRKKSKKGKQSDAQTESNVKDAVFDTTQEDGAKKEKSSKKEKKRKHASTEPLPTATTEEDNVEAAKAAKAARKEAKRARKAAKEAETSGEKNGKVENDIAPADGEDDADAKAARKAERKAEKAKLKAAKKEEKKQKIKPLDSVKGATDTETATPSEARSTIGSLLPSKEHSSATSPEPTPATTKALIGNYVEDPELASLPQTEIDNYLSSKQIAITDPIPNTSKYRPITSFSYLPIKDKSQLAPFSTFDAPTPIQAAAWPCLFAGRDVVGVAETGSGKTFAFGVPCIQAIVATGTNKKPKGVKSVIISPTRELASQIHDQMLQIAKPAGLFTACIYGGVPKDPQYEAMKKANIVVATPGRLNDLISEGVVDLSQVNYLVLDEADRMLEKGFEEEIRKIIGQTPTAGRQTLMFTATWPPSVRDLAMTFMKNPIKINIGDNHSGELRANTRIAQVVEVVDPAIKQTRLLQLLKKHQSGKNRDDRILVFCLYKKEATRIEGFIRQKGLRVAGIHGDLSQSQRTASLEAFKKGDVPILVATDVAARGLDIPAVKVVINVTFPLTAEDYVHRIGRTGRAGQDGLAITLFTEHDKSLAGALVNVLNGANQPVPEDLLKFGTTVKKKGHEAYGAFYKDTENMKKATKITFD